MINYTTENAEPLQPRIIHATIGELIIYQINEAELQVLENGSPDNIHLNIAIAFLTNFLSFVVTLSLVQMQMYLFTIFLVIGIVSGAVGFYALILWIYKRKKTPNICGVIRSRVPRPEGVQQPTN